MASLNDQQSARDELSADDDRKEGRRCWTYPVTARNPHVFTADQETALAKAMAQIARAFGPRYGKLIEPDAEDIAAAKANADGYTFSANYADGVST
jgi:hypothetical protein